MAQTYAQVTQQIADLQARADRLRQREISGVVERIKVAIAAYGLTAQQLFGSSRSAETRPTPTKAKRVAKLRYADGAGNEWSGLGPRPRWLRQALIDGKALQEFAQPPTAQPASAEPKRATANLPKRKKARRAKKSGKPRAARQAYSNGTDSWSGFGRQPRWLQAALSAGKTLEELKATRVG